MILNLHYMISLALMFVMFATGAWRKSFSTFAFLGAITVAMYTTKNCSVNYGHLVLNIVSLIMVFRAILISENDKLFK